MSLLEIVLLLLFLDILVIVHEFGHFWVARFFGVRIEEFAIGFGPLVAKRVRGGIQYSLRAVPLGGFVKMAGMDIAVEGESGPETRSQAADPGSLRNKPAWQKGLIVLAGPIHNLILGLFTMIVTFAAVGIPYDFDKRAIIGFVNPKTPAYEAGLTSGDLVVAIDGRPIELWEEMVDSVRASNGRSLTWTIERSGKRFQRRIKPFYDPQERVYRVGLDSRLLFKRLSLWESIRTSLSSTYYISIGLIKLLSSAVVGRARIQLSGPIGAAGALSQALKAGPFWVLQMVVSINIFLALFNLLPIPLPLLDGGWVVIFAIEKLRRREFTEEQKAKAQIIGLVLIAALFIFITQGDIISEIRHFINR